MKVSNFVTALQMCAERIPEMPAFTYLQQNSELNQVITYADLDKKAKAIASVLLHRANPGECALLLYPPGLDYIEAFFGCLYAGIVAVPLYPPQNKRKVEVIESIKRSSGAKIALSDQKTFKKLDKKKELLKSFSDVTLLATDTIDDKNAFDFSSAEKITSNTIAYLQYTSGSTSEPKKEKLIFSP